MQLGVRQIFAHQNTRKYNVAITWTPNAAPGASDHDVSATRHNTTMFRVGFPILVMDLSGRKGKPDNSKCTPSYLDDRSTSTRRWTGCYSTGSGVVGTAFSESITL